MFPHLTEASLKSLPRGGEGIRDPLLVISTEVASDAQRVTLTHDF